MRKFFIILLLFCIPTLTLAVDNSLQKDDETVVHSVVTSPVGQIARHYATLKLDYINYKLGKSPTVYSQILELENSFNALSETDVNAKYLKQLKDLYLFVISYDEKNTTSNTFLQDFNARKVVVDNSEYALLDKRLKLLLSVVNVFN